MQNYTQASNIIMFQPRVSNRVTEIRNGGTHRCDIIELSADVRKKASAKKRPQVWTLGPNDLTAA